MGKELVIASVNTEYPIVYGVVYTYSSGNNNDVYEKKLYEAAETIKECQINLQELVGNVDKMVDKKVSGCVNACVAVSARFKDCHRVCQLFLYKKQYTMVIFMLRR